MDHTESNGIAPNSPDSDEVAHQREGGEEAEASPPPSSCRIAVSCTAQVHGIKTPSITWTVAFAVWMSAQPTEA
jgi:hypothetical protein